MPSFKVKDWSGKKKRGRGERGGRSFGFFEEKRERRLTTLVFLVSGAFSFRTARCFGWGVVCLKKRREKREKRKERKEKGEDRKGKRR